MDAQQKIDAIVLYVIDETLVEKKTYEHNEEKKKEKKQRGCCTMGGRVGYTV
jgi:hypothetical protein